MSLLEAVDTMAKKAGRPKTSTGEGPPVRIEADLASMARYVAAHRGVPVAKLVSDLLRPAVEREFAKLGQKLAKKEAVE
jgi:hypothetical protein